MAVQTFEFLSDPDWRRGVFSTAFGKSFWGFLIAAALLGLLCWIIKGPDVVIDAFQHDLSLLIGLLPRVLVALSIAALIWVLLPREKMSALVGEESGLKGLVIATVAGTITPGGPSSAFSLLSVMAISGADRGALVTYITAWAMLALQRVLIWDVPFMGPEFALLRFLVCLPLPMVAGVIARRLPIEMRIKDAQSRAGEA